MDSTRISIAQLLALDVPLDWQDAVAVAHEVAMLNDVSAAMNARPPLVSPETCFLTRTGEVDLPDTADIESPEAVADLLRLMLAGRDTPEALEDLAFGRHSRDLSSDLAPFSSTNRHAVIAKLVTRALARRADQARTVTPPVTVSVAPPAPPIPRDDPPPEPARPVLVKPAPPRPSGDGLSPIASMPPPFQAMPPFKAAASREASSDGPPASRPVAGAAAPAERTSASEVELRRLQRRQADRAAPSRSRWASFGRSLARWISWRPSVLDPLVTGATIIVMAALAVFVWQRGATSAPRPKPADATLRAASPPRSAPAPSPIPGLTSAPQPVSVGAAPATAGLAESALAPPAGGPPVSTTPARPLAGVAAAPATPAATLSPAPRRGQPTLVIRRTTPVPPAVDSRTDTLPTATPTAAGPGAGAPANATVPRSSADPPANSGPNAAVVPPTPRVGRAESIAELPPSASFYSSNDADVEPPVMRRRHLPSSVLEPTADAPEDWPFLELLIDENGAVEQVRLHARQVAPGQTLYRHRMLLAAAKAWQFEPARRNGEPVRYVMRVPLEP